MKPEGVKAIVVIKSCLRAMNWNAKNMPITGSLLGKCVNAHSIYVRRLKETDLAMEKAETRATRGYAGCLPRNETIRRTCG